MLNRLALLKKIEWQKYASFIALLVLILISSFLSPYFLKFQNLMNILRQVSYTGIIALGMTFVIIGGGIDLSVGSMTAFIGAIVVLLMNSLGPVIGNEVIVIIIGIATGIMVGTLLGAFNGFMITKGKIAPFIVTLGSMAIFRSLTLYIGNAGEIRSSNIIYGEFGMESFMRIPVPVWVMLILAAILNLVLNNTRYGRYICAVGSNQEVARFSAINVSFVRFFSYTLIGILVAISSILLASRFNAVSTSNMGLGFELDVIAAVIVGGTTLTGGRGTVWGTVCGAIMLGVINNMMNMVGVSPYLQGTVKGIVILGAVYIQRQKQ
ncbi:MAG: ABC transporter permease [Candidatus Atribacteria bacterium]|nr:ABC transporter permease [Candidatus Atribacteria bacterium]